MVTTILIGRDYLAGLHGVCHHCIVVTTWVVSVGAVWRRGQREAQGERYIYRETRKINSSINNYIWATKKILLFIMTLL
jgi:hypothetical protein